MNALSKLAVGIAVLVSVFVLLPRHSQVVLFSQLSAGRTIRVGPGQAIEQRIWLAGDEASAIELSFTQKKNASLPVRLRLLSDMNNAPGQELASATDITSATENQPQTVTFSLDKLPRSSISEHWVWIELTNQSTTAPVFLFREIDSSAYPGGRLLMGLEQKNQPGVLAFTLYGSQLRWISPMKGLMLFATLLILWILVPWERLELSRA